MGLKMKMKFVREDAVLPKYQTPGSAGFDLHAVVDESHKRFIDSYLIENDHIVKNVIVIPPGGRAIVPTGIAAVIPEGYELQIRPRSGLAAKKGITITNSPGTVDCDYRNEIMVILHNLGEDHFIVKSGDRIAQGVLNKIEQANIELIQDFNEQETSEDRGGGFGSTGI